MPLTDIAIKNAKATEKQFKLFDREGLFMIVKPSGGKLWRLKYRHLGKEQQLSIGTYPMVSLKEARSKRDEARKLIAEGLNPAFEKKKAALVASLNSAVTFGAIAEEYIDKRDDEGTKPVTTTKARWLIAQFGKSFAARPISEIEPYELLAELKQIEQSGRLETARRCHSIAGRVFRYAVATLRTSRDISADLRGAIRTPKVKHHAAILDPTKLGELLRAIDGFNGQPTTIWALKILPHVFVRPGELRQAEWIEFDLSEAVWRIPAGRMKMNREHVVPLSEQVLAVLKDTKSVTGRGRFVFPSLHARDRCMSENTLNTALRRMGFGQDEMTSHGFRATASTLLNESGLWSVDAIERALAHGDANSVRGAYHRGAHWQERVRMAQWWSDHLDALRSGVANTIREPVLN
jgi:integrase